jgi:two-component system response regulator VicR
MKQRILIIEDDRDLARILADNLTCQGYSVRCVAEGRLAVAVSREFCPDLILLDVMLPDRSGFELCRTLASGGRAQIIFLTARSEKQDKLQGLNLGAADYVLKPFDLEELMARVRNVLRRGARRAESLQLGNIKIDFRRMMALNDSAVIELSHRELELLRYLAERQGQVVSREELLQEVWGYADIPATRSVDQTVLRIRKKLEPNPQYPEYIHTVHGGGYMLTPGGLRGKVPSG